MHNLRSTGARALLAGALLIGAAPWPAARAQSPVDSVLAVRRLLVQHEFETLDSLLSARDLAARRNPSSERLLRQCLDAFATGESLKVHLDAWVATEPREPVARWARATWLLHRAATTSGSDASSEGLSIERAQARWAALAYADLTAAGRLGPDQLAPFVLAFELRWVSNIVDAGPPLLAAGLKRAPASLMLRQLFLDLPGDDPRQSDAAKEAVLADAQRLTRENPSLGSLRGIAEYQHGMALVDSGHFPLAEKAFTTALAYGEEGRVFGERGVARVRGEKLRAGIADLTRAITLRPGDAKAYSVRAMAWFRLSDSVGILDRRSMRARAVADLRTAARLDPMDPQLRSITRDDVESVFSYLNDIWP